jgi:hypothetical protein
MEKPDFFPVLLEECIGHHCPGAGGAMKDDFPVFRDFHKAFFKFT